MDLVFLVDSSASVGGVYFQEEIKFVRKLLADFTVDMNTTRVAVITFSSREKVVRQVDHLTRPNDNNHKCSLLVEEIPKIKYVGGGTYTLGAFLEAKVSSLPPSGGHCLSLLPIFWSLGLYRCQPQDDHCSLRSVLCVLPAGSVSVSSQYSGR